MFRQKFYYYYWDTIIIETKNWEKIRLKDAIQ